MSFNIMILPCLKKYKNKNILNKYALEYDYKFLMTDSFTSHCNFHKRILRYKNLVKGYEKYLSYLTRFFERKFSIMFSKLKPKNLLKRIRYLKNKIDPI